MAALRDSLLASVGCGAELMLQGDGLGVDLAAVGRETGTVTLLAMLQIVDHALGRMRSSGHAAVLAEMAIVRLASLEDLDSLADAVERAGSESVGTVAPMARPTPPAQPSPTARPVEPVREKKTADLTQPVPIGGRPQPVAIERHVEPVAGEAAVAASAETARAESSVPEQVPPATVPAAPAATPASLPTDPLDAWRRGAETVGGLAVDFAELASRAAWRDDVLEVVLPASAGNAAAFLRRPEIAAGLTRALTELCGRPVRHTLVIDSAPEPVAAAAGSEGRASSAAERGRPAMSHAAMLRDAAEHPLVAHVRTLFDAAVRKVEPPRPRPATAAQPAEAPSAETPARTAVADDDERDHAAADYCEGGQDYGGIDG
jgi:DNA polymerase-3 subunit gamma/tau